MSEQLRDAKILSAAINVTKKEIKKIENKLFEELSDEFADKAVIGKVDVDSQQKFAAEFGVRNIPTVLIFNKGELVNRQVGVAQKSVYADFLNPLV